MNIDNFNHLHLTGNYAAVSKYRAEDWNQASTAPRKNTALTKHKRGIFLDADAFLEGSIDETVSI